MEIVSHFEGRARFKFDNLFEKELFLEKMGDINGILKMKENDTIPSLLIHYEPDSTMAYIIEMTKQSTDHKGSGIVKDDLYFYINKVLKHPAAKILWAGAMLGPVKGFLVFAVCDMGIHKYVNQKLG